MSERTLTSSRRGGGTRVTKRRLPAGDRRDETVARVAGVFAAKGFRGATSRDLAQAAGVSEAMVYKLFGSKRGLYRAIVERKIDMGGGEALFPREAARALDDREVLEKVAERVLSNMEEDPTFMRLFLFSALEGGELARMFVAARIEPVLDFLAKYFAKRIEHGAFRKADPSVLAVLFIGGIVQFVQARQILGVRRLAGKGGGDVWKSAARVFLDGVRRKP